MPDRFGGLFLFIIFSVVIIFIYFIPSIVARNRRHAQISAIFWLNFFTGWSFVGWVASLIWALTNPSVVSDRPIGTRDHYISAQSNSDMSSTEKICPMCAETVKAAAFICRYCGYEFPPRAEENFLPGEEQPGPSSPQPIPPAPRTHRTRRHN